MIGSSGRAFSTVLAHPLRVALPESTLREITIECSSVGHRGDVISAVQAVRAARIVEITDPTFEAHQRGKIHTGLNIPLKSRDDLSMAYTPGVARVCTAIAENRQKAFKYTIKANTVAVVTDGTAVLGLGDIGPEAAMPVMEGKAMLFKEFADVNAFPICLSTRDTDEIVETWGESLPPSAASTSRTSPPLAASRSSSACRRRSTSRSSTTTSTAPRL
jgi:malate dehydrogenase (oxaloacetate-decarboxylating)